MTGPVVALIAPGAMGAAVAARLTAGGIEVRTLLAGRSAASIERAHAAGMVAVEPAGIAAADIVLSIVPPGEAAALAEQLAPVLAAGNPKLVYADCNAVNPATVGRIAETMAAFGVRFVDGGIIGSPPQPGAAGPTFYVAGADAGVVEALGRHGLVVRRLDGGIGAASALKMSYGGITKGMIALASAMMLAATRAGAADAFHAELAASQPHLLGLFERVVPDMVPKAYRWVAEMEEVAGFAGEEDAAARQIYHGIAAFYRRLAADRDGDGREIARLTGFLDPPA
ncbi:MAG: DUF1932 domain-containing protein [Janthinobacterium lividum]